MQVALLHAFPLDARMWEPQLAALVAHDVVAPRLYGRGSTMDEWAASLLAELDDELVAVGNSLGGYVALALARVAPERVRALALVGARADADSPERREARNALITLVEREGPEAAWREMRSHLFSAHAPPDAVERARRVALDQDADELVQAIAVMRDRPDSTELVGRFEGPLLVAVGEEDGFFPPEQARALAGSAPAGRFQVFPGLGHLPGLEWPDRFNPALEGFLSSL
ncbi:MAG TPA: alpha/beta fold hydrolase [Gaiellaceae bacterium]|nr:alpha/beta fold hydrolase [Gaiellaceae bacterium]